MADRARSTSLQNAANGLGEYDDEPEPRAGIGRELAELRHRVGANDPLIEVVDGLMAAFKKRDKKDAGDVASLLRAWHMAQLGARALSPGWQGCLRMSVRSGMNTLRPMSASEVE